MRVSVVVVAHRMARELPRTLATLRSQHVPPGATLELVVVDNGSDPPMAEVVDLSGVVHRFVEDAPPSPAGAANLGLATATGDVVGLLLDGARMASPGLVRGAVDADRLDRRAVTATLGWHLGPATHMEAGETGWDQAREDALLDSLGWEDDGYALFGASVLAGSSRRGWFGPLGETNALFLRRALWDELGGLDERFALPGGGLVNHDLYRRACALPGVVPVVLLGEGTFHQFHGGAATSRRFTRDQNFADYEAIRGEPFAPPEVDPLFVGHIPDSALGHLRDSIGWALRHRAGPEPG